MITSRPGMDLVVNSVGRQGTSTRPSSPVDFRAELPTHPTDNAVAASPSATTHRPLNRSCGVSSAMTGAVPGAAAHLTSDPVDPPETGVQAPS
jgi:hypothetical protein